jgi:hypothetical protein
VRRIILTLILTTVALAVPVSPALAQVVVPSLGPSCPYEGPVEAGIVDFVDLTPCEVMGVSD